MAGTKRFDEFEDLVRHEALEIAGPNPALHCAKPCCDAGGGAALLVKPASRFASARPRIDSRSAS